MRGVPTLGPRVCQGAWNAPEREPSLHAVFERCHVWKEVEPLKHHPYAAPLFGDFRRRKGLESTLAFGVADEIAVAMDMARNGV